MKVHISAEVKEKIEAKLGRSADTLRVIPAIAWVEEQDIEASALEIAQVEEAAGPPMLSNGKPTVTRVVAWLAHEGINRNRQGFVKDELPEAAQKIDVANALVMDFNHSAVRYYSEDPKAIGYWHKAEYRRDPKAANGEGKFGILMTGTMWSWAFPDYANRLLAEQSRNKNGVIEFSMACLAESVEIGRDTEGHFEILHNPTFFTLSALDVPPADPDAVGVGEEGADGDDVDARLTQQLTGEVDVASLTEEEMEELMQQIAQLKAQIEGLAEATERAEKAEQDLATAQQTIAELTEQLEAAKAAAKPEGEGDAPEMVEKAQLEDMTLAHDGLKTELEAAQAKVTELTEQLNAANEKLAAYAETEAAEAKEVKLASRMAELPKSYITAFEKRSAEKQAEMKARWADMSDEQWSELKDTLGVGEFQISYLDLSNSEGGALPQGTPGAGKVADLLAKIRQ